MTKAGNRSVAQRSRCGLKSPANVGPYASHIRIIFHGPCYVLTDYFCTVDDYRASAEQYANDANEIEELDKWLPEDYFFICCTREHQLEFSQRWLANALPIMPYNASICATYDYSWIST